MRFTECLRKNVPLQESNRAQKGTFFLRHPVVKRFKALCNPPDTFFENSPCALFRDKS